MRIRCCGQTQGFSLYGHSTAERTRHWRDLVPARGQDPKCRHEAIRTPKSVHRMQRLRSRLLTGTFARRGNQPATLSGSDRSRPRKTNQNKSRRPWFRRRNLPSLWEPTAMCGGLPNRCILLRSKNASCCNRSGQLYPMYGVSAGLPI